MSNQASPATAPGVERFRELLEARRRELIEDDSLSQDAANTVELDQMRQGRLSRVDALQQQAMAAETHRRRVADLKRIAAALARIETGDYGYCLTCGQAIAPGRLEIDPAAAECVRCAGRRD
jgi:DnaK suppressor protein